MSYEIGQIIYLDDNYPEAVDWCDGNNATIIEIEPDENGRRFQIVEKETHIPTYEEQRIARENAYQNEVDPITCNINRLRDENPVPEDEIAELIAERGAKVEEIKARYPYPEE